MKKIFAVVVACSLSACVAEQPRLTETPSGRPEVEFNTSSISNVSSRITNLCGQQGLLIQEVTAQSVTCGGEMQGGQAALASLAIGNSYSTTPRQLMRFTMYQSSGKVRVQAYQWIETQMAFGQINRLELNSNNQFNDTMRALQSIGGTPVSTLPPA